MTAVRDELAAVALTWQRITTGDNWIDWPDHPTDLGSPLDTGGTMLD